MPTKSGIYIGEVVNILDPDKLGRSQVRIHGIHDDSVNIPSKDLLWCFPMKSSMDPSLNKIGTGGNGLLVGSKVLVHIWDDMGKQSGFIIGSVPKSGDAQSGATVNGQPKVDTTKSDAPTAARNNDVNPVVGNPIQNATTTPGSKDDSGQNIYTDIAKKKAQHGAKATIGAVASLAGKDVIALIKKVDPSNLAGSLPQAVSSMQKLLNLNNITSAAGLNGMAGNILGKAMGMLSSNIGSSNMMSMLGNILSASNASNTSSNGAYQFTDDENILEIVQQALYQYGLSLQGAEEILISTDDTTDVLIESILADLATKLAAYYSQGQLTKEVLLALIEELLALLQQQGQQAATGTGSDMSSMMSLIPALAPLLQQTMSSHLPKSVLDISKIQQSLQKFTKAHALLNIKQSFIKQIFSGVNSPLNLKLSNLSSLAGLINPGTGLKIGQ